MTYDDEERGKITRDVGNANGRLRKDVIAVNEMYDEGGNTAFERVAKEGKDADFQPNSRLIFIVPGFPLPILVMSLCFFLEISRAKLKQPIK